MARQKWPTVTQDKSDALKSPFAWRAQMQKEVQSYMQKGGKLKTLRETRDRGRNTGEEIKGGRN